MAGISRSMGNLCHEYENDDKNNCWLQNKLNILPEETMAFGDNENDVEMFAVSKYSIAVSNARKEVRDAAFYVTKSNDEAGVLNILKKWGV